MRDDEDAPLTDDQRALAESGLPIAWAEAARFARRYPRLAGDFFGAAMLALCTTARAFGPDCGSSYANYAGHRVRGACADVLRDQGQFWQSRTRRVDGGGPPRVISLHKAVARQDDESRRAKGFGDVVLVDGDRSVGHDVEWAEEFEWAIAGLNERTRTLFRLVYGPTDMDQKSAGRVLGLGQSKATRLHASAVPVVRARLKKHMDEARVGAGKLRRKGA